MKPVWINNNKPEEKKNEPSVFVNGVHFPKKFKTEITVRNGKEITVVVRHPKFWYWVEHEQDEEGNLLYMSPCGGCVKESELEQVAECIMKSIRYFEI